jgi:hypothetical protein
MTNLARRLRLVDYFALAFGVMVGTAWLVVMDDILRRGGALGALLRFTAWAMILLVVAYVYGQLVPAIPDASGEADTLPDMSGSLRDLGWVGNADLDAMAIAEKSLAAEGASAPVMSQPCYLYCA